MDSIKGEYPKTFKGFGVGKVEDWNHPKLVEYEAKNLNPTEVCVKVICCGVCASDVHNLNGSWGKPFNRHDLVVGHEVIGKVVCVGPKVTEFKIGDRVGIGASCKSCGKCVRCDSDNEQYCRKSVVSFNAPDWESNGYITQGGFANYKIADERFTFRIPEKLNSEHAAPMMCGGLTVFSPLVRGLGDNANGKSVGIIGIGGLGHMAVQFAAALGAEVTAFSRTSAKKEQCFKMGATNFIATQEDPDWYKSYSDKFDMILNCASSFKGVDNAAFNDTLKIGGLFTTVGAPPSSERLSLGPFDLIRGNIKLCGSLLGSKKEATKMLQLAADKGVEPWIEKVPINAKSCGLTLERCEKSDVRYRFVFTDFDKVF